MSIASEITRINNNIASAYTACNNKGATMPVTQNSANLATCINSIQTGGGGGGGSTWQVVEGIITSSDLDFVNIYDPNSEYATFGNFIYLVFDNGTLLFATPAYKRGGTLVNTGVLALLDADCYARCYTQDEISIVDSYSLLVIQGYDELGNEISGTVNIEWTDPTA